MRHMRIIVTQYGELDKQLKCKEERLEPKRGEVRVRMLAGGVSSPDLMMREGVHTETPRVPFTPGWDLVGVMDRICDGVSGIKPAPRFLRIRAPLVVRAVAHLGLVRRGCLGDYDHASLDQDYRCRNGRLRSSVFAERR